MLQWQSFSAKWGLDSAPKMYKDVYARESESTRDLVQPITPPMSDAAKESREALFYASAEFGDKFAKGGSGIQIDWRPRPRRAL